MSKQQSTPLKFWPQDGDVAIVGKAYTADHFRAEHPALTWLYNPWTGDMRARSDIASDPYGHLIRPPGEPVYAAKDTALDTQVGGSHYKDMRIQPVEYIHANGIPFIEGAVIKYVSRWRAKGGIEDVKKARHFLDLLIQLEERKNVPTV